MEEYSLSPQIANWGQENMTTKRVIIHSSPLGLCGLLGFALVAQVPISDKHACLTCLVLS
eukprot:1107067-Pyramimonas_sp.AAC.1